MVFSRSGFTEKPRAHRARRVLQRRSATGRHSALHKCAKRPGFLDLRPRAVLGETGKRCAPLPPAARRVPRAALASHGCCVVIVLLMGPAGSGKTTIGILLA